MKLLYIISIALIIFIICFINFVQCFSNIAVNTTNKADGIIVLTGGHARLNAGLNLLKCQKGRRMLLSGVNKHLSNKSLIDALNLHDHNLIQHIDIGRYALNTAGNAFETALWVKKYNYKTIYVVTNDYHMPRSLLELKMALPDIIFYPAPIKDYKNSKQLWQHLTLKQTTKLLAEFLKYIRSNIKFYLITLINQIRKTDSLVN